MKWYIGQEIVAIVDHSQGKFKKGDVFTIKGLRNPPCGCTIQIDVGIKGIYKYDRCTTCDNRHLSNGIHWFKENCFAPLDFDISELTSILETPLELAHEQQRKEKGQ